MTSTSSIDWHSYTALQLREAVQAAGVGVGLPLTYQSQPLGTIMWQPDASMPDEEIVVGTIKELLQLPADELPTRLFTTTGGISSCASSIPKLMQYYRQVNRPLEVCVTLSGQPCLLINTDPT